MTGKTAGGGRDQGHSAHDHQHSPAEVDRVAQIAHIAATTAPKPASNARTPAMSVLPVIEEIPKVRIMPRRLGDLDPDQATSRLLSSAVIPHYRQSE